MRIRERFSALVVVLLVTASPRAQAPPHDDCRDLNLLAAFARIYGTVDITMIERKVIEICDAQMGEVTLRWPDQRHMKSAGQWVYPNRVPARSSGGTWRYPNSELAKSGQGEYRYPDGGVARTSTGSWRTPYNKAMSLSALRAWARDRVPPADFTGLDARVGEAKSEAEVVALLELAWLAR